MNRRGAVIFVVLLAVVAMSAGLISMLGSVRGQTDAIRASVARSEQRLAHRSAAVAIMAELYQQRERVLSGQSPELAESQEVLRYENDEAWQWSLQSANEDSQPNPIAGRIDINHVDDQVLLSLLDSHEADSEHVAMHLPLRTPGMIRHVLGRETEAQLAELFTVTACDTQVRSNVGSFAANAGQSRVEIGSGEEPPSNLSQTAAAMFRRISTGELLPSSRREILMQLEVRGIDQSEWDIMLDTFDIHDGEPSYGLISLSHADARVLAALPGVDEELAERLVDHRESLAAADLSGVTWPVREGLVSIEEYAEIIDMLCARSLQYEVEFSVSRVADDTESVIEERPVGRFQMVVDISGSRPRLAYLRDVSYLPWEVPLTLATEELLLGDSQPQTNERTQIGDDEVQAEADVVRTGGGGSIKWGRLGSVEQR